MFPGSSRPSARTGPLKVLLCIVLYLYQTSPDSRTLRTVFWSHLVPVRLEQAWRKLHVLVSIGGGMQNMSTCPCLTRLTAGTTMGKVVLARLLCTRSATHLTAGILSSATDGCVGIGSIFSPTAPTALQYKGIWKNCPARLRDHDLVRSIPSPCLKMKSVVLAHTR